MSHIFTMNNVLREDVITNGDGSSQTLANAPEQAEGGIVVPKTILDESAKMRPGGGDGV